MPKIQLLSLVYPSRFVSILLLLLTTIFMSSCTSLSTLLFYPKKQYYYTPEKLGLEAERVNLTTSDGETLANWLLTSPIEPRGTVLFLHGNGENISTHIQSVAWLPQQGYEVFLLDYRGYGKSTGTSMLSSALSDVEDAHRWLSQRLNSTEHNRPLFVFGQSLGGALAITYTANYSQQLRKIEGLISESAPASWPQIAREAMRNHWLTWLLQIPASLMPGGYDAEDHIAKITNIPILLMHSPDDPVVAYHHGQQLLAEAKSNTLWLDTQGGHIGGLNSQTTRKSFLAFLGTTKP